MRPNRQPHRHAKRRAHDNLVFGRQPVAELLQGDKEVDSILIQTGAQGDVLKQIRQLAVMKGVPVKSVPVEKLNRLTGGNHQGVIAFTAAISYVSIADLLPLIIESGEVPLIIVLDGITDVGNFGAIARTAWAAGAHALVIAGTGAAPVNADAMKASAGALQEIPVCREAILATALETIQLHGLAIYGADAHASAIPATTDLSIPCAIVMGSEDRGISSEARAMLTETVSIPMARDFDSYNVSVAAGMLLYEAMKQRSGS
ncbi:MAG: 23S rRNA (guanosine(2251)-2'-O)-methyltransferase RlmB [Chitinophagales bacterium]|nr:23S rRNA (guanosine(2251)-2'-O)-methyltransferase RlmB [Chitinophagales bacterium]HAE13915.1 23S rRNA (guanosine(2251)-2'-O)-methyltransferase RlmB [Bacteroidota bacterium]MCB9020760.1 23S rRNA (guanosine(2251)-2'-O)-methyltransferase RlmB [Chitinophagales bacterium]MCB9031321.1 23S rRNA (guanosine(2251)-2'-O)-methyltransferase RlmB [Chitinophagales bacterium]HPE97170.1 23S rRNA (guanosine(2251)-2'-O)-methyltransferase RlmB [Chitinophagales bacterium]